MYEVLLAIMFISGITIAFCAGYLRGLDSEEERISARVIRPANITVEKKVNVVEYTVTDSKALDIDFPNSRSAI